MAELISGTSWFKISKQAASQSQLLSSLVEMADGDEVSVDVGDRVHPTVLASIVDWLDHHAFDKPEPQVEMIRKSLELGGWDKAKLPERQLGKIIMAADYLGIDGLQATASKALITSVYHNEASVKELPIDLLIHIIMDYCDHPDRLDACYKARPELEKALAEKPVAQVWYNAMVTGTRNKLPRAWRYTFYMNESGAWAQTEAMKHVAVVGSDRRETAWRGRDW